MAAKAPIFASFLENFKQTPEFIFYENRNPTVKNQRKSKFENTNFTSLVFTLVVSNSVFSFNNIRFEAI